MQKGPKPTSHGKASVSNTGTPLPKTSVNKDAVRKTVAPQPKSLGPRSA